ncbi:MAG TPA: hypothetical protein VFM18_07570 [Methanosarcina sp.]|nr:hypothetical protein [Methanosarcina sp.]
MSHNSATLLHKNKVFLDTGAAHGGKLSAFVLRGNRFDIVQVDCKQRMADGVDKLPTDLVSGPKVEKQFRLSDYDLDDKDLRLLRQVKANDIQYISGTMPPAPSCEDGLETLKAGLDYFKSKGVDKVVVEPKYMGNRGQLYLHRSAEIEDFAVSRSGWRIRHVDGMDKLLEHWHKTVFQPNPGINSIILDGEILPWTSMGASLIDHTFIPYGDAVRHELSTLAEDKEFASFDLFKDFDAKGRLGDLEKYERTLSIFTQNTPLEFKPFSVLAINGKKYEGDEFDSFTKYNKDTCIDVDLSKEEDYQTARMFYSYLTTEVGMEGVVIKPLVKKPGVVPYMKVRNQEYLRLIYGYDYTRKLDKFIQTKNISGKVSTAIREHDIAEKMIGSDWDTRQELVVKMIGELKKEAALDPRL